MKNIKAAFVLGLVLYSNSTISDTSASEVSVFDTILPGGMSIAQTLEEWDRSAMRYHNEPPEHDLNDDFCILEKTPKT